MKRPFKETAMSVAEKSENHEKKAKDAKQRLIDAAEDLFAAKGFDATSIRDLTTRADCNLAAVNYHFGTKDELYAELFRHRFREMRETRVRAVETVMAEKPTLERLIHIFAEAFLEPFADRQASQRFMQLFAREMFERRLPKGMFVKELAGPTLAVLRGALQTICPYLDETATQQSIMSVVAQLIHVIRLKGMLEGGEEIKLIAFDIDRTIEHIVMFSAAGIRAYGQKKGRSDGQ